MEHYIELLVFRERVADDAIAGMLQIQPHTTMRELRYLLAHELGMACAAEGDAAD